MKRDQIAWWLWAVGTVLIVLSWTNTVPVTIGWLGFAIGIAGSALSWGLRPPSHNPTSPNNSSEKKNIANKSPEP